MIDSRMTDVYMIGIETFGPFWLNKPISKVKFVILLALHKVVCIIHRQILRVFKFIVDICSTLSALNWWAGHSLFIPLTLYQKFIIVGFLVSVLP